MLRHQGHCVLQLRNVLFLCTGNSARSILAEAILNHLGRGRFHAYSAGSHPTGKVNPFALEILREMEIPVDGARSKGWNEFASPGAPRMDYVITVCDNAAGEACPVWPGTPDKAHWGIADPAAAQGTDDEKRAAFRAAATILERRIRSFLEAPVARR
jgi:arsenate reductase